MNEKKMVSRSVVLGLGIICIVVVASLVGAFAYYHYNPIITDKDNSISSLNAEIHQLNLTLLSLQGQVGVDNLTIQSLTNQLTNLQNQLNWLFNVTVIPIEVITSNPSAWVNRTVTVEGGLSVSFWTSFYYPSWSYDLSSGNQTVGVSLGASVNTSTSLWNQVGLIPTSVRICGVVEKGEITSTNSPPEVAYYIEAEKVEFIV